MTSTIPIGTGPYEIPITGKRWQRIRLDGIDSCIIVENPKININDKITIEIALILREIKKEVIISKKDEYSLCFEDSGRLNFSFGKGSITSDTSLVANQFYHIGLIYDGNNFHIYIFDGRNEIEQKHKFDDKKYIIGNSTPLNIGKDYDNKNYSNIDIFWLSIMAEAISQPDIDEIRRKFEPIRKFNCQIRYDFRFPIYVNYNLFKAQKIILERLFVQDWFIKDVDKKNNHPAYKRWLISEKLFSQNGIIKYQEDIMADIAQIIIDNGFLVEYSSGDLDRFVLGDFLNCDEKVLNKIYSEIEDPSKFFDKLTELSYAAWHLLNGNKIIPYEEDGCADLKIIIKNLDLPIVVDCKRIKADTQDRRFAKDIVQANKQIKKLKEKLKEECYGIVLINISDKIKNSGILSEIPGDVKRIMNIVQDAIRSNNSSVSGVLLTWDEWGEYKIGIQESTFVHAKKSVFVRHLNPKKQLPFKESLFNFGGTFLWKVGPATILYR